MDKGLELRKILLRLADNFERRESQAVTFTGENAEESAWLDREFARLASEGSVSATFPGPSPGYRFTTVGYNRYLPQIQAWRLPARDVPGSWPPSVDLDMALLYSMMGLLRKYRTLPPTQVNTSSFESLLGDAYARSAYDLRHRYVNRHLEFLELSGLITVRAKLGDEDWAGIALTLGGQKFVQPALAEFGQQPLLPEVIKNIEEQIHTLTKPPEEKATLLFRLREAISKNAPDLVVKFLAELASATLKPGP
jgi:hypothetical protein